VSGNHPFTRARRKSLTAFHPYDKIVVINQMCEGRSIKTKTGLSILLILFAVFAGILLYISRDPVRIEVELSQEAPLSALASIKTREPTQVSVRVKGKHDNDLLVTFDGYHSQHEIPILGLYPEWDNEVEIVLVTEFDNRHERTVTIRTQRLPDIYPDIRVDRYLPDQIARGMTFLHLAHYDEDGNYTALPSAVDSYGEVRWIYAGDIGHIMKQLDNGHLLIQKDNSLVEIDMLGNHVAVRTEAPTGIHHDMSFTDDGNMLILSSAPSSFEDGVVEMDGESGEYVQAWDFRKIIDPERPPQPRNLEPLDWVHLNGIDYRESDESFIVSGRDQSAVVAVERKTGELIWIIGNHERWEAGYTDYLLEPIGEPFEWQWGQHAPMVNPQDPDRILIYDNGNERSYDAPVLPENNYSRAVEYRIDEQHMLVEQVWQYGEELGSETFTPFIGDANYLSNGNRLVCFGGITRDLKGYPVEIFDFEEGTVRRMKMRSRIVEVTEDMPAKEVMRISISHPDSSTYEGYRTYQAERYPLYHPGLLEQ
jgi:arylsulfate sulfotransferase